MNEQEQPIIEALILIDEGDYKSCHWYWMRKEKPWLLWVNALLWIAFLLICIYFFVSTYYLYGAVLLALALVLNVQRITAPGRYYKKNRAAFDAQRVYAFYEDCLFTKISDRGSDSEITSQYSRYLRAEETKTAFYLKTPDKNYVNLPKKCFSEEQIDVLRELFGRKFGEKFKECLPK